MKNENGKMLRMKDVGGYLQQVLKQEMLHLKHYSKKFIMSNNFIV